MILNHLIADDDICLEFVSSNVSLEKFDEVILPGSKLVIKDLIWLKETGLFEQLQNRQKSYHWYLWWISNDV